MTPEEALEKLKDEKLEAVPREIISAFGITSQFLEMWNFKNQLSYSLTDASLILQRSLLLIVVKRFCLQYDYTYNENLIVIRRLQQIDYISIQKSKFRHSEEGHNYIPIEILMFLAFGGPFLQLPYYFMENDIDYVNKDAFIAICGMKDGLRSDKKTNVNSHYKTYIMEDPATDLYKIGKAINVSFREKCLAGQIPLIKTILYCDNNCESFLHQKYADKRKRGEWFKLSCDDIHDLIKDYGFKKYKLK